jgi:uncharacterized protein
MGNLIIDAFEFCRLKERQEGSLAISELARVQEEAPGEQRSVSWSIVGGADHAGHAQLSLSVDGVVSLICQRCLNPVDVDIASRSLLVLARTEDDADGIEALLADDSVDVVVVDKKIDITELIEDEVLLAIPQSVKHEACPSETNVVLEAAQKPSAFAALKDLKL